MALNTSSQLTLRRQMFAWRARGYRLVWWGPAFVVACALFLACSDKAARETFTSAPGPNADAARPEPDAGSSESSSGFTTEPCNELACMVADCGEGSTTTLSGKVYDPAGVNPLYNVQVYVPSLARGEELPPLRDTMVSGLACETCASVIVNPMTSALTNEKGEFTLENVPVGKDIPIVVQVGKWRRKFEIEVPNACAENQVPDRTLKLPRNAAEGDMPQIAVTTAGCDALECLLRGIGIDDSEFVNGHAGTGHVHLFQGSGGQMGDPAQSFWNDGEQLKKYDIVLLGCECAEVLDNKGGDANVQGARGSMADYLNAGGRVFSTHYQYAWFRYSPQEDLRRLATWSAAAPSASGEYDVNTTFPKGDMLAKWLVETGGTATPGKVPLNNVTSSITAVNYPAVTWISKPSAPKYFSFNTPQYVEPDQQCGRAVFSDLHVTGSGGPPNMKGCAITSGALSGQQKALEFLFFDLSSCVQNDAKPPVPPTK